jgi:L-seryl-tRNA(Ser) seleniumtransferase
MKSTSRSELFRELPSVDEVLRRHEISALIEQHGSATVADGARTVLARLRSEIASGLLDSDSLQLALRGLNGAVEKQLRLEIAYSLRPVVNATGVILHTNLGRAPLAQPALDHVAEAASGYSNLEYEIEAGERGKRDIHVQRLLRRLLEDSAREYDVSTIVVNNNAAAVLLALNTLAEGGEVIVSRGELVEIGGSFRIPDVMTKSGAILSEVGTTNRTRIADAVAVARASLELRDQWIYRTSLDCRIGRSGAAARVAADGRPGKRRTGKP